MALTAKYEATCGVCAGPVAPGDQIEKAGARWAHVACAAQDATGAGPAPARQAAKKPVARPKAGARAAATTAAVPVPEGTTEVWTDGACSGNPGPGGWAWATRDGRSGSGGEARTTNQRMEVRAVLEALGALEGPLVVVSDSTYVVNCFRDSWWRGWLSRGWLNSAKQPVANRDLWEPLIDLYLERGDVTFRWVKGHSGDEMNDLVDRLAVQAGKAVA